MGSAGNAVIYAVSQFGQGVLIYPFREGMKSGAGLNHAKLLGFQKLFSYAQDGVVVLAKEIGGVQNPIFSSPGGPEFTTGQVDENIQANIPLQLAKPRFIRTQFREITFPRDTLEVNEKLKEILLMSQNPVCFLEITIRKYLGSL